MPLNGLTLTLLMLGALAALTVGLLVLAFLRPDLARRLLLPVAALAIFGLGIIAIVDRMAEGERFAERRALAQRRLDVGRHGNDGPGPGEGEALGGTISDRHQPPGQAAR